MAVKKIFCVNASGSPHGSITEYYEDRASAIKAGVEMYRKEFGDDGCLGDVECELDENGLYDDGGISIEITWDWLHVK